VCGKRDARLFLKGVIMEKSSAELEFETVCNKTRAEISQIEKAVRQLHRHDIFRPSNIKESSYAYIEVRANITLAFRHLEDARMRLGKAIQYATGNGTSCYDDALLTK
jgi:hypothetical protein